MPPDTSTRPSRPRRATSGARPDQSPATSGGHGYVVPWVHVSLPESAVNTMFWASLAGAAIFGAVDPPLAALIGAGVIVSRHRGAR